MKKRIALALCLVLLVSLVFAGCGTDAKEDLLGNWECQIDVSEMVRQQIADGDESLAGYFDDLTLGIQFDLAFGQDDTFTMEVNREALEAAFSNMIDQAAQGMLAYFEDLLVEQNLDMTVEELLELSGIASIEELLDQAMAIALEEMDLDSIKMEGTYAAKNGKLVMTVDDEEEEVPYTLKDGALTLSIPELEEILGESGEMVFHKAG